MEVEQAFCRQCNEEICPEDAIIIDVNKYICITFCSMEHAEKFSRKGKRDGKTWLQ